MTIWWVLYHIEFIFLKLECTHITIWSTYNYVGKEKNMLMYHVKYMTCKAPMTCTIPFFSFVVCDIQTHTAHHAITHFSYEFQIHWQNLYSISYSFARNVCVCVDEFSNFYMFFFFLSSCVVNERVTGVEQVLSMCWCCPFMHMQAYYR